MKNLTVLTERAVNNPNDYNLLLESSRWKSKRAEILNRDGNKCRNCGSASGLEVHHRQYHCRTKSRMFVDPWDYDNKYLITLCSACHSSGHQQFQVPVFYF